MTFEIQDELDIEFRRIIGLKRGIRKGVIGQVLEEAIKMWMEKQK